MKNMSVKRWGLLFCTVFLCLALVIAAALGENQGSIDKPKNPSTGDQPGHVIVESVEKTGETTKELPKTSVTDQKEDTPEAGETAADTPTPSPVPSKTPKETDGWGKSEGSPTTTPLPTAVPNLQFRLSYTAEYRQGMGISANAFPRGTQMVLAWNNSMSSFEKIAAAWNTGIQPVLVKIKPDGTAAEEIPVPDGLLELNQPDRQLKIATSMLPLDWGRYELRFEGKVDGQSISNFGFTVYPQTIGFEDQEGKALELLPPETPESAWTLKSEAAQEIRVTLSAAGFADKRTPSLQFVQLDSEGKQRGINNQENISRYPLNARTQIALPEEEAFFISIFYPVSNSELNTPIGAPLLFSVERAPVETPRPAPEITVRTREDGEPLQAGEPLDCSEKKLWVTVENPVADGEVTLKMKEDEPLAVPTLLENGVYLFEDLKLEHEDQITVIYNGAEKTALAQQTIPIHQWADLGLEPMGGSRRVFFDESKNSGRMAAFTVHKEPGKTVFLILPGGAEIPERQKAPEGVEDQEVFLISYDALYNDGKPVTIQVSYEGVNIQKDYQVLWNNGENTQENALYLVTYLDTNLLLAPLTGDQPLSDQTADLKVTGAVPQGKVSLQITYWNGETLTLEEVADEKGECEFQFREKQLENAKEVALEAEDDLGNTAAQTFPVSIGQLRPLQLSLTGGAPYNDCYFTAPDQPMTLTALGHPYQQAELTVTDWAGNPVYHNLGSLDGDGKGEWSLPLQQWPQNETLKATLQYSLYAEPAVTIHLYIDGQEPEFTLAKTGNGAELLEGDHEFVVALGEIGERTPVSLTVEKNGKTVVELAGQTGREIPVRLPESLLPEEQLTVTVTDLAGNQTSHTYTVGRMGLTLSPKTGFLTQQGYTLLLEGSPSQMVHLEILSDRDGRTLQSEYEKLDETGKYRYPIDVSRLGAPDQNTVFRVEAQYELKDAEKQTVTFTFDTECALEIQDWDKVSARTTSLSGRTDPNAAVTLNTGKETLTAQADASGAFTLEVSGKLASGATVTLSAVDERGNASAPLEKKLHAGIPFIRLLFLLAVGSIILSVSLLFFMSARRELKKLGELQKIKNPDSTLQGTN